MVDLPSAYGNSEASRRKAEQAESYKMYNNRVSGGNVPNDFPQRMYRDEDETKKMYIPREDK
jgi:hypothetical protein